MQRSIKASPAQKGRGGRGAPPEFGDGDPTAGDEAAPPLEDDEIKPEAAAAAAPAAKAPSERQLKDLDARIAENTRNGRISWKSVLATLHKSDLPGDQSYWMRWSRNKLQEWCRPVRKRKRPVRKDKRKRKRPERKRSEASKQADREAQQRRRAERRISES